MPIRSIRSGPEIQNLSLEEVESLTSNYSYIHSGWLATGLKPDPYNGELI
jgi:hypothetical protein